MPHREGVSGYLRTLHVKDACIADWGRGTKPVTNYLRGSVSRYIGIDKLSHVGADIVADLNDDRHQFGFTADVAFCMEVLEHVRYPATVLRLIHRHLVPNGLLHLSVPFLYPIHSEEDYWRFTDQGLTFLLRENGFVVDMIEPTEQHAGWVARAVRT